jgi:hypothetical protein
LLMTVRPLPWRQITPDRLVQHRQRRRTSRRRLPGRAQDQLAIDPPARCPSTAPTGHGLRA